MATRYFRFRLDDMLVGLVRRRDDPQRTPRSLSRVVGGEWVDDPSLYRYWLDPGDVDLVEIDAVEARRVADAMGVELIAKATLTAPVEEDIP